LGRFSSLAALLLEIIAALLLEIIAALLLEIIAALLLEIISWGGSVLSLLFSWK
jgi:hypothetical protein